MVAYVPSTQGAMHAISTNTIILDVPEYSVIFDLNQSDGWYLRDVCNIHIQITGQD